MSDPDKSHYNLCQTRPGLYAVCIGSMFDPIQSVSAPDRTLNSLYRIPSGPHAVCIGTM